MYFTSLITSNIGKDLGLTIFINFLYYNGYLWILMVLLNHEVEAFKIKKTQVPFKYILKGDLNVKIKKSPFKYNY